MAKILISYYKIQEINKKGILGFWGGLFKDLVEFGNELFVINTAYYNNYHTNEISDNIINQKLLKEVQIFNPEIIITFNHRIPKIILDNFLDVPIYIWDGDELKYFCDLAYIRDNLSRYKIISFVEDWKQNYLDFGFKKEQIFYMPIATSVSSLDIEQKINISFVGEIHYSTTKLANIIKTHKYNRDLYKILLDYYQKYNFDFDELVEPIVGHNLNLETIDLYPLFDNRILTLANILDLGLKICGNRWDLLANILPQLNVAYDVKQVWTLEENEVFLNSSKLSISPIHPQARGSGYPWRVFDVMASNACLISEYSKDLKKLTKDYVDLPMFHTPWEARKLCVDLLKDHDKRSQIVKASQEYINKNARWKHRFMELESITN